MAPPDIDGIVRAVRDNLLMKHESVTETDVRVALAASPVADLLEGLEWAVGQLAWRGPPAHPTSTYARAEAAARAAIAKARGEDDR